MCGLSSAAYQTGFFLLGMLMPLHRVGGSPRPRAESQSAVVGNGEPTHPGTDGLAIMRPP